jgi:hypothetical protein
MRGLVDDGDGGKKMRLLRRMKMMMRMRMRMRMMMMLVVISMWWRREAELLQRVAARDQQLADLQAYLLELKRMQR